MSLKKSFLADLLAATYIACCFLKSWVRYHERIQAIVFSRGAFRNDIPSIISGYLPVVIHGEWLRRFFRLGVPDGILEQVVCLSYQSELRTSFPLSIRVFRYFTNRKLSRIVFGGVDYFEVAIFADHVIYLEDTSIEAVFHENYAIEYVKNINFNLYNKINGRIIFDRLYTYGPPATHILKAYTSEACGPRPMAMPRLANMENDEEFNKRLDKIDHQTFGKSILLLAFPGTEYLAPLCFTATLLELARLGRETNINPVVKFKNHKAALSFKKQISPMDCHIQWVDNGSIENLVWKAGFTLVFNSISLYEALLGPTIVIIPAYLDAMHDENLLQETQSPVQELCGELKSVRFVTELSEIYQIVKKINEEDLVRIVKGERDARKALVRRKFYLHSDVALCEKSSDHL